MEDAQPLPHDLGDAPALGAVEEDVEDERLVDRPLRRHVDVRRREEAATQRAEGLARGGDATVDVDRIVAETRHVAAEISEARDDGHESPARQQHVREVGAVEGGRVGVHVWARRAEEDLGLRLLGRRAVRGLHTLVHLHAPALEVLEYLRCLLLDVLARCEGQRRVVGVLRVDDRKIVAVRRRLPARHRVVVARSEDAQVVRVLRAPRLHDGADVEDEEPWPQQIALLDADDREENPDDTVDLELDVHQLVQRDEQRDDLGRHTVLEHHLPEKLSWHAIKSLDKVDEEDPRLEAVLAPLGDQLPHREDGVGAAALASEAALRLVVERLDDRLQPLIQQVRHDLVRDLKHHDTPVVARLTEVALLRQDGE
mmetsp:Transcript_64857/g.193865  ORF Transcript_64857/g.193865 Transcript_64857/m.193865 type:complete len:370 (+) Transcript_64857:708-1817(+)